MTKDNDKPKATSSKAAFGDNVSSASSSNSAMKLNKSKAFWGKEGIKENVESVSLVSSGEGTVGTAYSFHVTSTQGITSEARSEQNMILSAPPSPASSFSPDPTPPTTPKSGKSSGFSK